MVLQCQTPFKEEDIVILNGSEEDIELMATKMEARSTRLKAEKKDKKSKKSKIPETITSNCDETDKEIPGPSTTAGQSSNEIQTKLSIPATSRTTTSTKIVKPMLKRESTNALDDPEMKKLKDSSFSVAADPKASDVYKSLFTSHKSEKEQNRAHWVTYNPFYN